MTLEERQAYHDAYRTTLKPELGRVELMPAVKRLDPRMIGRLISAVAMYDRFHAESDHSNGVLIFAGFTVMWELYEEARGLCLLIGMYEF